MGLSPETFWSSTPRELGAYRKITEHQRHFFMSLVAGLQAALHNGPLIRKDGQLWEPEMLMPDYVPQVKEDVSWKAYIEMRKAPTGEADLSPADQEAGQHVYAGRRDRVAREKEEGASRERLMAIMNGEA